LFVSVREKSSVAGQTLLRKCVLRNQRDEPYDIMGNNFMLLDIFGSWTDDVFILIIVHRNII